MRRRDLLICGGTAAGLMGNLFARAHATEAVTSQPAFLSDPDQARRIRWRMHDGKGMIDVKVFFAPEGASRPAALLLYDIPPGASEGVHTHNVGDSYGCWDEFYYVLSGTGSMPIDGHTVPVKAGDHIYTPHGVAHGIENTSAHENLKVYLVAMNRD